MIMKVKNILDYLTYIGDAGGRVQTALSTAGDPGGQGHTRLSTVDVHT